MNNFTQKVECMDAHAQVQVTEVTRGYSLSISLSIKGLCGNLSAKQRLPGVTSSGAHDELLACGGCHQ
jgi:hypothetical protein